MKRKYKLRTLSVRRLIGYAIEEDEERYSYHLNAGATHKCFLYRSDEQDDCALFHQIMCVLHGGSCPSPAEEETLIPDLEDVIFYADFTGIFNSSYSQRYLDRQKKAESMFRPEGVYLDFGTGEHRYLAFERSGNMSRKARLSFLRADVYDAVRERIMLGMKVGDCQLSKLYAYLGLMLSGGTRVEGIGLTNAHRVIVVDNPTFTVTNVNVITVEGGQQNGGVKKYTRAEKRMPLEVMRFDGEGLISKQFARTVDISCCGEHIHSSFQIRLPFVKGMLHQVDFQDLLTSAGMEYIEDIWGARHPVRDVDVILTKSMFKGYGWLTENGMGWEDYLAALDRYDHALYITNVSKPEPEEYTELNYQFLSTLSMTEDEFHPRDLPLGWDHSPAEDPRHWITKATEQRYYNLCADPVYRLAYFTRRHDTLAKVLMKNPLFLNEPVCINELDHQAKHILDQYARGRLLVAGDNRFLSGDLLEFVSLLIKGSIPAKKRQKSFYLSAKINQHFYEEAFYAPKAAYKTDGACTLLRNPHIARNEELQLRAYREKDNMREYYLGHLSDVIMVDVKMLAAERLGGADYDGDMIKTIADPIVNECVRRNYEYDLSNNNNLPLLYIPSEEPVIRNANDWHDRFVTVRDTFSTRVGQICNAAFDRSIVAYDENGDAEDRQRCREETETLAILTGLEIDAAKSGVKPDIEELMKHRSTRRSTFLQFKVLLDDDGDRAWYEPTTVRKKKKFIESQDWDAVSSNVERLPYLSYMLEKRTPKLKPRPASDAELFSFAARADWKERLDKPTLRAVSALLTDYEKCLTRIRGCRAPIGKRGRQSDIDRILFGRGQEDLYDTETLYAVFSELDSEYITELRRAIREEDWHLMDKEARLEFLHEWLPDYEDYFPLFSDFRFSGYRILGDLVSDIDDENAAVESRKLYRDTDSETLHALLRAYAEKPQSEDYREAVARACRKRLDKIIRPHLAVWFVVALGKRKLLWDLLPDAVAENVARYTDDR